ncbi:MAG: family N-acetyltransferase [Frankiales bacterium]|jgi:ribosomal protein S18 acetylase RimI-like enzyme|nr:family N-acetyltransferase [Frankiales bacterium]
MSSDEASAAQRADHVDEPLLAELERFFDAVPRNAAVVEKYGPLTLFVRQGAGWPFYARPTLGNVTEARASDVKRVRARQRELGVPEAFEWVAETHPRLGATLRAMGFVVREVPLMAHDAASGQPNTRPPLDARTVRVLGPDDPALPWALALPHVVFGAQHDGLARQHDVAAAVRERASDGSLERVAQRIASGLTSVVAALSKGGDVLCSGQRHQVGAVSEIVAMATLPHARRQGLGTAVTDALVNDAYLRRASTVFLSAESEDVARLYARSGFRRAGTAAMAEPPAVMSD